MVYGLNGSIPLKPLTSHGVCQHTKNFLDAAGNFQCPFRNETRQVWTLDDQAQVYTFTHPDGTYRLVFEWEYGVFFKPIKKLDTEPLLENLGKYWKVYEYFHFLPPPPYRISETLSHKPVTCVANFHGLEGIVAHKLDGTVGRKNS
ncbi:uncharacterized protein TNCV_4100421 [Trichonephila clavipes]|nr:uncharacterized protein TNCV_4100421 [Trichonephila clavipes]